MRSSVRELVRSTSMPRTRLAEGIGEIMTSDEVLIQLMALTPSTASRENYAPNMRLSIAPQSFHELLNVSIDYTH